MRDFRGGDDLGFTPEEQEAIARAEVLGHAPVGQAPIGQPGPGRFLVGMAAGGVLVLFLAGLTGPQRVPAEPTSRQRVVAQAARYQLPAEPPPAHVLLVQAFDGQTYRVESRNGCDIQGQLPPGFYFGRTASDLLLSNAPQGRLLGRMAASTCFLYTGYVYEPPCWRWIVTLDGAHQGFSCFPEPSQLAETAPEAEETKETEETTPDGLPDPESPLRRSMRVFRQVYGTR